MKLARTLGSVGGLTLLSRLLALVRDSLQARYVGANFASDAFLVAFRLPNMFRAFFAEGAFSSAFIPMFNKALADGDGNRGPAFDFAERTLAVLFAFLAVMTVVMLAAAWPLTAVLSGGFHKQSPTHDQFAFAVELSRITIPYLMLICLASLLGGILNSLDKFWVNAAAPVLLNIAMVCALFFFNGTPEETARAQAIAVPIGGVLQLVWLWIACRASGVSLRPRWPRLDAEVKKLMVLILPAALGAGAVQLNLRHLHRDVRLSARRRFDLVHLLCRPAEPAAAGDDRHWSRHHPAPHDHPPAQQGRGRAEAMETQNRGMELALFLTLPAMVALIVAAEPIVRGLFQYGHFTAEDTRQLRLGARGLLDRPAFLCAGQGADSWLLCAARHADAGAVCDHIGGGEHRGEPGADPAHPSCRPAAGDGLVVHDQRLDALSHAGQARPFRAGRAAQAPPAPPRAGSGADGRGSVRVEPAARSLSDRHAADAVRGAERAGGDRRGDLRRRVLHHPRLHLRRHQGIGPPAGLTGSKLINPRYGGPSGKIAPTRT
jgi:hypothetical protein